MSATADLLSRIRDRIDAIVAVHTKALISAPTERTAGKIEALLSLKKDLSDVAKHWQSYDPEELEPKVAHNAPRVRR